MSKLTPEIREEISRDLRKTRAPARTARNLGYTIHMVLEVLEEEKHPRPFRDEVYGGLGRPDIRDFTVDRKKVWEVWDNDKPAIAKARADYEAGTIEMCTGRDGDWLILYAIPRTKQATDRAGYFLPENM